MPTLIENQGLWLLSAVAVITLAAAGGYFWRQWQTSRHERQVEKVIRSLGVESLHNVVLPDGVDGLAFIDYLLLTPQGIVVLDVKHQQGVLFGGETVDRWTQVIDGKTYKFPNPLYAHQNHRQAVEWNCEDVTTHGRVVFSNAGRFPKGIPAGSCMIDDLPAELPPLLSPAGQLAKPLRDAWTHLHDLSVTSRARLGRHEV